MLLVFIFIVFALLTLAYYLRYTKAKNKLLKFTSQSSARGYKTKVLPFEINQYYIAKYSTQDQNSLKVFKQEWSKEDVIVGNVFSKLGVMVGKPELIKDLCNQMSKFQVSPFIAEVFEILNGGGLLFTQGEIWKRKRRIISSVFHYQFLNNMIPMIENQIDQSFALLDRQIKQGNKQINLRKIFTIILSKVVVKSFFGVDINQYQIEGTPYCEFYLQYLEQLGEFIWSWEHIFFGMKCYDYQVTKKCRQMKRKYDLLHGIAKEITQKQIEKIRNNQEKGKNMLTSLYENNMLSFEGKQNQTQYTMYELIGQFFTFIAAGTDTTANSLNLALHYLSDRPQWVQKIRKQTQEMKSFQLQSSEKLKKLKVTEAIFNQTLRTNGAVAYMFSREALQDVTIGDNLLIPKGTFVTISPLMCHYREQIYKNPSQFMPQRWLDEKKTEPYSFLPFSGGQRNCIGQYLARIESKLILSKICQKYSFKALNPIKMKIRFSYSTQGETYQLTPIEKK